MNYTFEHHGVPSYQLFGCPLWREPPVTDGFPSHNASSADSFVMTLLWNIIGKSNANTLDINQKFEITIIKPNSFS